MVSVTSSTL